MKLSLDFTFDSAHRIVHHPGKCARLHGHTWKANVVFTGDINTRTGMVIDFFDLKRICKSLFDEQWDHVALLNKEDEVLIHALEQIGSRHVVFPFEPTSEMMSQFAFKYIEEQLPSGISIVELRLWETPGCSAITDGR